MKNDGNNEDGNRMPWIGKCMEWCEWQEDNMYVDKTMGTTMRMVMGYQKWNIGMGNNKDGNRMKQLTKKMTQMTT